MRCNSWSCGRCEVPVTICSARQAINRSAAPPPAGRHADHDPPAPAQQESEVAAGQDAPVGEDPLGRRPGRSQAPITSRGRRGA